MHWKQKYTSRFGARTARDEPLTEEPVRGVPYHNQCSANGSSIRPAWPPRYGRSRCPSTDSGRIACLRSHLDGAKLVQDSSLIAPTDDARPGLM